VQLEGITAVVTGGASGLGAATARRFAEAGAKVAVLDLDGRSGEAVAGEIGGRFVECDVGSEESATIAMEQVAEQFGVPRAVVCCAGVAAGRKVVGRHRPHELDLFERVVRVNLTGTFNIFRLAAFALADLEPVGPDGERGVLVATASIAAFDGVDGGVAYSASKAGVAGMMLPLARDLAAVGIRAVAIAPGSFDTPMAAGMPPDYIAQMAAETPFPPRFGHPEEFAELAAHIVTNPMLNGTTIRLDGGIRMTPSRLR
jgi:NAD(P)-dependent dehydrogenase (short-subunit alcohol dehydrogenase family)